MPEGHALKALEPYRKLTFESYASPIEGPCVGCDTALAMHTLAADERGENNSEGLKGFRPKARARIWS